MERVKKENTKILALEEKVRLLGQDLFQKDREYKLLEKKHEKELNAVKLKEKKYLKSIQNLQQEIDQLKNDLKEKSEEKEKKHKLSISSDSESEELEEKKKHKREHNHSHHKRSISSSDSESEEKKKHKREHHHPQPIFIPMYQPYPSGFQPYGYQPSMY